MNSNASLVSIIMPAYNCEKYIAEAIESILEQSYKKFELLIFDDGSTDSTKKIISSYQDSRIKPIYSETNIGVSSARNEMIRVAGGEFIALMDADDISHKNRLECQINYLKAEGIDLCGSRHVNLNQESGILKKSKESFLEPDIQFLTSIYCPICNSTIAGKSSVFKNTPYRTDVLCSEDYYFLVDCITKGYKLGMLGEYLLTYRQYSAQSSSTYSQKFRDEIPKVQQYYLQKLFIPTDCYPRMVKIKKRIQDFKTLIICLRKYFSSPSFGVMVEIYSRFQFKQKGILKLYSKLERVLVPLWIKSQLK
jgi:glycosyltransferase involved in cell wall biosynthesis